MRRLSVLLVLAIAACHPTPTGALAGGSTPRGAVEQFLAAANAQDLQALGAVWGDEKGLARDKFPRQEVERQELIMISLLRHDSQTIGDAQRVAQGRILMSVALSQGKATANTKFTLAQGAASRWFVQEIDLKPLQNAGFGGKAPAK